MKLEIKHLAPYLPHNLKFGNEFIYDCDFVLGGLTKEFIISIDDRKLAINVTNYKPLLRQLSDYADINSDAMNSLNCDMSEQINLNEFAIGYTCLGSLYQSTYDLCLKNHIDIFGLIDQDLALPLI